MPLNLQPALHRALKLHDTCGVHNLHGMPGVLAGLIGALMAALATEKEYGERYKCTFHLLWQKQTVKQLPIPRPKRLIVLLQNFFSSQLHAPMHALKVIEKCAMFYPKK
jgi:ammonia channel protein AmtB